MCECLRWLPRRQGLDVAASQVLLRPLHACLCGSLKSKERRAVCRQHGAEPGERWPAKTVRVCEGAALVCEHEAAAGPAVLMACVDGACGVAHGGVCFVDPTTRGCCATSPLLLPVPV